MNIRSWMLNIFLISLLLSCQAKEVKGTGGLIAGHAPVTNSFSVQTPSSRTFVTGEVFSVVLNFPYAVVVTGSPRLLLTVGSTSRYATYASGTGTKSLTFSYTILAADNDTDGIALNSLQLNGGTLTFSNNGTTTTCDPNISAVTFTSSLVDNTAPTISSFNMTNFPLVSPVRIYHVGDQLNFTMTFSEKVYVTGSPRFLLTFTTNTGSPTYATYTGGSGTTTLGFSYTIENTVADTNGISITSPISLNSGTIKDASGNDSSLDFSTLLAAVQTYSQTVLFDGRLPYVIRTTSPSNGSYAAAQNLDVTLEFDRVVTITGTPYLVLTIGSSSRQATYVSGSGTKYIIFRYSTVPGDVDSDGITIATSITQNAGTIAGVAAPTTSFFTQAGNNQLSIASTTGVLVAATQPQPTTVSRAVDSTNPIWGGATPDNVWMIGQDILITVAFNTNVYVTQTSGTPRIPLTIGATTRYATYLSGGDGQTSLIFRYVVVAGDNDSDGSIDVASIDLNGGTITDAANTNALLTLPSATLTSTSIDGVRPTIASVTPPANGTYSTIVGNMNFTVTWSEAVNLSAITSYLPLTVGVSSVNATWVSGANTTGILFRATSSGNDLDGITVNSPLVSSTTVFKDQAGNTASDFTLTPPNTTAVLVDNTAPTVTSVTPPANGIYVLGDNLNFAVNFSESVNVNVSAGYPRISLTIGATTRYLVPIASGPGTSHTFRYTIVAGDNDSDGVATNTSVQNNGASYIRDTGLNNLTGTFTAPVTTGVIVDAVQATVSVIAKPANGTYQSTDVLSFTLRFSETVTVTGAPRIQVTAQTGTLNFDYVSGSGTTDLVFSYTALASNFDFDGLPSSISTIDLNSGTIKDPNGVNTVTSFDTPANLSLVYLTYPGINVWTTSTFSNRAPSGITVSTGGTVTTEACGTGTCRTFDGDDTVSLSAANNGVDTVLVVLKTPSVLGNYDIFPGDLALTDDSSAFDISSDGTLDLDGVITTGLTHDKNLTTSAFHILQIDFTTAPNFSGVIIPSTFIGAIGEIIMLSNPITPTQKTEILTYLNAKY